MSSYHENISVGNGSGEMSQLEAEAAETARIKRMEDYNATDQPYTSDEERANEERKEHIAENFQAAMPMYIPNPIKIDAVSLAKAQGRFINEQTRFLVQGFTLAGKDYMEALSRYSRAQTELITAMQTALHQAEII